MHEHFLLKALEQAKLGQGMCVPNPCVGAVVVKEGSVIAKAYHHGAGTLHAERLLIDSLPSGIEDLTLYVTLEPCNHFGRTPPCVDAIIHYGFKRVVFAYLDPNPTVRTSHSRACLEKAGIEVLHYPIAAVDAFYAAYRHWTVTGTPWVNAKIAQTFDGKIAAKMGQRTQLSNAACMEYTHQKRLSCDLILTTARTVNQDDPLLNVRLGKETFSRPVAILDRQLQLASHVRVLDVASHCHIFHDATLTPPPFCEKKTYHGVSAENQCLSLHEVISIIGKLGYHSVWVEAGGQLFSAMHRLNLVQRTYCYLVPKTLEKDSIDAYHGPCVLKQAHQVSWLALEDNMVAILDWEKG